MCGNNTTTRRSRHATDVTCINLIHDVVRHWSTSTEEAASFLWYRTPLTCIVTANTLLIVAFWNLQFSCRLLWILNYRQAHQVQQSPCYVREAPPLTRPQGLVGNTFPLRPNTHHSASVCLFLHWTQTIRTFKNKWHLKRATKWFAAVARYNLESILTWILKTFRWHLTTWYSLEALHSADTCPSSILIEADRLHYWTLQRCMRGHKTVPAVEWRETGTQCLSWHEQIWWPAALQFVVSASGGNYATKKFLITMCLGVHLRGEEVERSISVVFLYSTAFSVVVIIL